MYSYCSTLTSSPPRRYVTTADARPEPRGHARLTLLDPFTARGVLEVPLQRSWGMAHYGEAADYCEVFVNTDDPVPSTNGLAFKHAVTYDVTGNTLRAAWQPPPGETMHGWPVAYVGRTATTPVESRGEVALLEHGRGRERGQAEVVP